MDISPIKSDDEYFETLKKIERLMTALPNTPEGRKLNLLTTCIETYEKAHYSLDIPIE